MGKEVVKGISRWAFDIATSYNSSQVLKLQKEKEKEVKIGNEQNPGGD